MTIVHTSQVPRGVAKEDPAVTGLTKNSTKYHWDVITLSERCTTCEQCVGSCPMGAVDKVRTELGIAARINPDTCVVCYICQAALACPEDCFDYVPL